MLRLKTIITIQQLTTHLVCNMKAGVEVTEVILHSKYAFAASEYVQRLHGNFPTIIVDGVDNNGIIAITAVDNAGNKLITSVRKELLKSLYDINN